MKNKVSAIVCDNASNMRKAVEVLADMKLEETAALVSTNTVNPDPVDDDTLWEELPDEDQPEVDAVLDCNTI